ncbi:hypothetical protein GLW00_17095 [Halobacillus litoralis]|uniref:Uncharacterized protein n=1 Tax=Halobacillus litoralis TaxID=45668 RepID=A0A845FFJ6_9BACI|nr:MULTISPECIES: hypothetical protein [Halobacillus]MEC3883633.1 hypothetical protein [Halobacillus sp. HZG1]MYL72548.1 hypothetical protein [Halobacillus litoralis]
MEQASWFDFVEKERDPVYEELQNLTEENPIIRIASYTITLNPFALIEIESDGVHDCVSDLEACYKYLCNLNK